MVANTPIQAYVFAKQSFKEDLMESKRLPDKIPKASSNTPITQPLEPSRPEDVLPNTRVNRFESKDPSGKSSTAKLSQHFSQSGQIPSIMMDLQILPTLAIVTNAPHINLIEVALFGGDLSAKKFFLQEENYETIAENQRCRVVRLHGDLYKIYYQLEISNPSILLYVPGDGVPMDEILFNHFKRTGAKARGMYEINYVDPEDAQLFRGCYNFVQFKNILNFDSGRMVSCKQAIANSYLSKSLRYINKNYLSVKEVVVSAPSASGPPHPK